MKHKNQQNNRYSDSHDDMETIKQQLEENGYDYAIAIATKEEVKAGAACGQLAIIDEDN